MRRDSTLLPLLLLELGTLRLAGTAATGGRCTRSETRRSRRGRANRLRGERCERSTGCGDIGDRRRGRLGLDNGDTGDGRIFRGLGWLGRLGRLSLLHSGRGLVLAVAAAVAVARVTGARVTGGSSLGVGTSTDKDVVLSSTVVAVELVVLGRCVRSFLHLWIKNSVMRITFATRLPTNVVPLLVVPVERLLGGVRAVAGSSSELSVVRVGTAAARELGLGNGRCSSRTADFAPERVHVVLLSSAVRGMDPEPSADAPLGRARRHSSRDLEVGVAVPYTLAVRAEDGKVFGLDIPLVGLVGDGESTAGGVILSSGVELRGRLSWARPITLTNVATIL
jgi:hypothetical protein